MSFLTRGFSSPFATEDNRAREDREQRQLQRKMQEDAARARQEAAAFRQESEVITRPFLLAEAKRASAKLGGLFGGEADARIQGFKARQEANQFNKFADETMAPTLGKLFARGTVTPTPEPGLIRPALPNVAPTLENFPPRERSTLGQDLSRLITPLAPKSVTDAAADVLGRGARFGLETGGNPVLAGTNVLSQATGFNPTFDVAGARFQPLRSGLLPQQVGDVAQAGVEAEAQRLLPAATSPVAILGAAAFPGAAAFGMAGAGVGGMMGRGLEEAGFDPRLRVDPGPLGETNLGPRALGEIAGGLYGGPGRKALAIEQQAIAERGGLSGLRRELVTGETGGTRLPGGGPPDVPPMVTGNRRIRVINALRQAAQDAPERHVENVRLSREEFGKRAANAAAYRDELLGQGVPAPEAMRQAKAALKGEMPFTEAIGVRFEDAADEAWFWDQVITKLPEGRATDVLDYMDKMAAQMARGDPASVKDFPPFIWRALSKAFGEDFTGQMQIAVQQRIRAAAAVGKEEGAARLAREMQANPPRYGTGSVDLSATLGPPAQQLPAPRPVGAQEYWAQPRVPREPPLTDWPRGTGYTEEAAAQAGREGLGPPPNPSGEMVSATTPSGQQTLLHKTDVDGFIQEAFPPPGASAESLRAATKPELFDYLADSLGLFRAIMASADLSFYRQTGKTIGRHPLLSVEAGKMASKAAFSESTAVDWMTQLSSEGVSGAKGAIWKVQGPDGLREVGHGDLIRKRFMSVPGTPGFESSTIMERPEFFISKLAARLHVVKQSGRAFAIGWNTQYAGLSRDILKRVASRHGGELTPAQVEAALNLSERLLGVGTFGNTLTGLSQLLKAVGFAPGYRVSGPEAFANLLNWKNPEIARIAADELFTWATLGNTILTAAKYGAGANVVLTLGSPQFGRIQFPGSDTYYNIWGTDQVLARTILQGIRGERVDKYGNVTPIGNQSDNLTRYTTGLKDALTSYARSGADPIIGLIAEVSTGETYGGKNLKWDAASAWTLAKDRAPMILNDLNDIYQTDGPIQTLLSFPGVFTGTTGVSSYKPTAEKFKAIPRYNTTSPEIMQAAFGKAAPPLNLTANEERELMRFVGRDGPVQEYISSRDGPRPKGVSTESIIQYVGKQEGLDPRMIAGAVFISKADSHKEWWNPEFVQFGLEHESELADRFNLETQAWKFFRQNAIERGLIPAR